MIFEPASRIRLELLTAAHANEMFSALTAPAIYHYIPNLPPTSVTELTDRYRRLETRASPDGSQQWLNWAVRCIANRQCIGHVQATIYPATTADFGVVLAPAYWGLGLAREAATAALSLLFTKFRVPSVFATVDRDNLRSSALFRRLGFTRVSATSYPHGTAEDRDDVFRLHRNAFGV